MKKGIDFQTIKRTKWSWLRMTEVGNEANMAKIRELRNQTADEVNMGDKVTNGVPIDFTSEFGKTYQGAIVFKRPSVMDFMRMGATKSEIFRTSGVNDLALVDNGVRYMAQVLATLKTVVVKSPEWLVDIDAVQDMDLLFHIHTKYEEWEDSFRPSAPTSEDAGDSEASE